MKVLLISPIRDYKRQLNIIPPLGLGYLASSLRNKGHEVNILDCSLYRADIDMVMQFVNKDKPDVVGFGMLSTDIETVRIMSERLKKETLVLTIAGGVHPSSTPEKILQELPYIDFAFQGESEVGLSRLLSIISDEMGRIERSSDKFIDIPGLIWKQKDRTMINQPFFAEDLDSFEYPAWDLINPLKYQATTPKLFVKKRPFAPIIATRGCPYHCTFCASRNVSGNRTRSRSVKNIIGEIELLRKKYGIREIHFMDDNFTHNSKFISNFCNELIKRQMDIVWNMPNGIRLDTINEDSLNLMKKAGCYLLTVGIESGSNSVLEHMKKNINTEIITEKVRLMQRCGFKVHGLFIVGYPTETKEDIQKTLKFAINLNLFGAQFSNFHPFPGTQIFDELSKNGGLSKITFSQKNNSFATISYVPKSMTPAKLKRTQRWMLIRFYFRPRLLLVYFKEFLLSSNKYNFIKKVLAYLFID